MLHVQQLHKRFGDITAVNGLSFTASDGAITGLLGANGAGKTTTLAMIFWTLTALLTVLAVWGWKAIGRELEALREMRQGSIRHS